MESRKILIMAARVAKLLAGLSQKIMAKPPADYPIIDGHQIADDYIAIADIKAIDIVAQNPNARELMEATAKRWGVDITLEGID